jgi:large subunit ribosomal protein L9
MNVILLEKIGKLGGIGDTANVKSGYARNFLFPFGKAIPATKTNLEQFDERRAQLMAAHDEHVATAQSRAKKVIGLEITIEVNASDEGKLFGSVGTKDIADAINAASGGDVEKSEVHLPLGVIRDVGEYELSLDFGYDVDGTIKLSVITQKSAASVSDDGSIEVDEESAEETTEAPIDEPDEEVSSEDSTDESAKEAE